MRSDELSRRRPIKLGDILYYFNCDAIGRADYADDGSYQGIAFLNKDRELDRTGTSTIGSALTLKKMISDIKMMKMGHSKEKEQFAEDERNEMASLRATVSRGEVD